MKALLVIDVQNGIVAAGDFKEQLSLMESAIRDFKEDGSPVIFMRHLDDAEESSLFAGSAGSELHDSLKEYADYILEKRTPSSFYGTGLSDLLESLGVRHLFVVGFETEFCCMFTAIAAFDRGYSVTWIQNATGTTNTGETYEMPELDIPSFVGKVLRWSNTVEVLDYEDYVKKYKA